MFHISLSKKYRPKVFSDIIAQSHVISIIKNSIKNNKFYHSYIFNGIRGIGKTSLGRIISKSLNCEDRRNSTDPCLRCMQCIMLEEHRHPDVIEVDAASNNGISNIRNIIENSKYKPIIAIYKIYIIDEVHMLSYSAFNSLLKILEEPPLYVKFILMTTEINKIPLTILSRCYRIDMHRIYIRDLAFFLKKISMKENFFINVESLFLIAKISQGAIRDGISILDQALSICRNNNIIDMYLLKQMLGIININYIYKIFFFISKGQIKNALNIVRTLYLKGSEASTLLEDLLDICYKLTIFKINNKKIILSNYELFKCSQISCNFSVIGLIKCWKVLNKSLIEIQNFTFPLITLEMIVIKLCNIRFFSSFNFLKF